MLRSFALIVFSAAMAEPACGQATASHARLSLVSEQSTYLPSRPDWIGVLFDLDPGWHVYWQNPGDSGTAPVIDWKLPPGFQLGPVRWPIPTRLGSPSVVDYGYTRRVLLMAPVTPPAEANSAATIKANVKYIVCQEICVPGKAQLTLSLQPTVSQSPAASGSAKLFSSTRGDFPKPAPAAWKITADVSKQEFTLKVRGAGAAVPLGATFFPQDPAVIENAAKQKFLAATDGFDVKLRISDLMAKTPARLRGLLVVPSSHTAFEISAPIAPVTQ